MTDKESAMMPAELCEILANAKWCVVRTDGGWEALDMNHSPPHAYVLPQGNFWEAISHAYLEMRARRPATKPTET